MKQLFLLFRLRQDERRSALVLLMALMLLQVCGISHLWDTFSTESLESGDVFFRDFHVSGFDPITYYVTTYWKLSVYQVYRHPLLAFFVLPFWGLNQLLVWAFGVNMVLVVLAFPLLFSGVYTFVFLYRILREQAGSGHLDALLLSWLFMGFAYIMVPLTVADHFAVSMFLLVGALYVSGLYMKRRRQIDTLPAALMFLITAGVTLSNGLKIFIDLLFVNGWKFFRPRFLLLVVIIPVAILGGTAYWEDRAYVKPKEKHNRMVRQQAANERRQALHVAFMDTTTIVDSAAKEKAFRKEYKRLLVHEAVERSKKLQKGKPISTKNEFARWTDIGTERWPSLVENFFGESIQLHPDHLLDDTLRGRPVIVEYRWWVNYVIEALLVVLFLAGIWCGRRSRFLWMVLSGFAVDLLIHIGLGFGLNEVYIMGPHWLFVMPVAMVFFLHRLKGSSLLTARSVLLISTLYLWFHNASLLISFYLTSMSSQNTLY